MAEQHGGQSALPGMERAAWDIKVRAARQVLMPFGKYRGRKLGAIADDDPRYLDWLAGRDIRIESVSDAVTVLIQEYDCDIRDAIGGDE